MAEVPREEMYFVEPELHEDIKEAILVLEDNLVDHAAIARKDEDGMYYLGRYLQEDKIEDKIEKEWFIYFVMITWLSGVCFLMEDDNHIFGKV